MKVEDHPTLWRAWFVIDNAVKVFDGLSLDDFRALPDDGMEGMMLAFPDATRRNISGSDWYWALEGINGPIYGQGFSPEYTSAADVVARYPGASVKRGKYTDEVTLQGIFRDMENYEPYAVVITAG